MNGLKWCVACFVCVVFLSALSCSTTSGATRDPGSISADDVKGDVVVAPGMKLGDLGNVAVSTFTIMGVAKITNSDGDRIDRKSHPDTMGVTGAFLQQLLGAGVVLLDRQKVDERLKELLDDSNNDLINMESAPPIGELLGAQTLIVGEYLFNGEFEATEGGGNQDGESDLFIKPERVYSQSIRIKGFDVATGRLIIELSLSLDEEPSANRLLPKSLVKYAAKRLLEKLD